MRRDSTKPTGFTIVELLIVIVVIAILAAITIVAYNGIQQRANNTKRIAAVKQITKLIDGYIATYGTYPSNVTRCLTADNLCTTNSGTVVTTDNSALMTELRKIGTVPNDVNPAVNGRYGIQYNYNASATFNGEVYPVRIEYWLDGGGTNCGFDSKIAVAATGGVTSTTGYTFNNTTWTTCWVMMK